MSDLITQQSGMTAESASELAAVAREQSEIQSAIVSAKKFPRNEQAAFVKALNSFRRQSMAEAATYSFPRGGKTVEGPSVDCARELARVWGNIRYGLRIVSQDDDHLHIRGYALDLETNTYVEAEDEFSKLIQRKDKLSGQTKWVTPDERDLRELMNRRGAIAIRNCLLQLLPSDLVEDALKEAKNTLKKDASSALERNRDDVVKALVVAFDRLGVTVNMLESFLGHAIAVVSPDEVAELRTIHAAIRDGVSKRDEYFNLDFEQKKGDAVTAKLSEALKKKLSSGVQKNGAEIQSNVAETIDEAAPVEPPNI